MSRILRSPSKYVQGQNSLTELAEHLEPMGSRVLIIISASGIKRVGKVIEKALEQSAVDFAFTEFVGECCDETVNDLVQRVNKEKFDIVAGVGGGKILDTAKAVADTANVPAVIIPTVASTDAPCSALSVLYTKDGVFSRYLHTARSPDLVLVDTETIVNAPVRLLVAGMGDAMATYFEARAVQRSGSVNQVSGLPTCAGFALAETCWETLKRDGVKAKISAENKCITRAFENIVEANIYLSGVGFESGGLAAAHALQKGFTLIPALHEKYHGEIVAFGTLVQLVLENAPSAEIDELLTFCKSVGLPTCAADLTDSQITRSQWMEVAEFTCRPGMTIHKMPLAVTSAMVCDAIIAADAIGSRK